MTIHPGDIADTDLPVPFTLTPKAHAAIAVDDDPDFPPIVCLCGSTRFHDEFRRANLRLTLAGQIVLSIGCDTKSDDDLAAVAELGSDPAALKARLDKLHKRKIALADYVLVLNVGGYIGESTRSEIDYALALGVPVCYLQPPAAPPQVMHCGCGYDDCSACMGCAQFGAAVFGTPSDSAAYVQAAGAEASAPALFDLADDLGEAS